MTSVAGNWWAERGTGKRWLCPMPACRANNVSNRLSKQTCKTRGCNYTRRNGVLVCNDYGERLYEHGREAQSQTRNVAKRVTVHAWTCCVCGAARGIDEGRCVSPAVHEARAASADDHPFCANCGLLNQYDECIGAGVQIILLRPTGQTSQELPWDLTHLHPWLIDSLALAYHQA